MQTPERLSALGKVGGMLLQQWQRDLEEEAGRSRTYEGLWGLGVGVQAQLDQSQLCHLPLHLGPSSSNLVGLMWRLNLVKRVQH